MLKSKITNKILSAFLFIGVTLTLFTGCTQEPKTPEVAVVDSLFIHLSSDEPNRARKALGYALNQRKSGTEVLVWLDDRGVRVADKSINNEFAKVQTIIADLATNGVDIIVCPMGMSVYGVNKESLVEGVRMGGSQGKMETKEFLFRPNTKTLSW